MAEKDTINFSKLERELNQALADDERYWVRNEAKFRAVHQKVATYEEFEDIVEAAHLKPLDKGDTVQTTRQFAPWNPAAAAASTGGASPNVSSTPVCSAEDKPEIQPLVWNRAYFEKQWKVATADDTRFSLLERVVNVGETALTRVFAPEFHSDLLMEIVNVLHANLVDDNAKTIKSLILAIASSKRLKLTVDFLSINDTNILRRFLEDAAKISGVDYLPSFGL